MERLTEKTIGCFKYDLKDFKHKPKEFNDYDAFYAYNMAVKKLGEYEDLEEQEKLFKIPFELGKKLYDISEFVEGVYCPELIEIDSSKIEISRDGEGLLYIIDCSEYRKGDFGTILFDSEDKAWDEIRKRG